MEKEYRSGIPIAVWCLTRVEAWSAVCRVRREGRIGSPEVRLARSRLHGLTASWIEVDDWHAVATRAQRLLELHPLRAGHALQLAAALVLVFDRPERVPFVTLDDRLAEAAEREGFEIVGVLPS
jgi:hypothetical protein